VVKAPGSTREGEFEYIYDSEKSTVTIIGSNEEFLLENGSYKANVGVNKMDLF